MIPTRLAVALIALARTSYLIVFAGLCCAGPANAAIVDDHFCFSEEECEAIRQQFSSCDVDCVDSYMKQRLKRSPYYKPKEDDIPHDLWPNKF
jgi:hypothetical protein